MRRVIVVLFAAGLAATAATAQDGGRGDAAPVASGTTTERTLQGRTYRLHLPARPAERLPLVISLHGAGGTGRIQEELTRFDALADEEGFAVAYPDGRKRMWAFFGDGDDSDGAFVASIVDDLIATIDSRRVYVCGISNGAFLANRLAYHGPHRFAAFGAVAGSIPKLAARRAREGPAVPFIYFHGTDDRIVGYDGTAFGRPRATFLGAEELVSFWVERNGCAREPVVETRAEVERRTYASEKAPVVFHRIEGGGHTWPGGAPQPEKLLGKTPRAVDASRAMWEFFRQFAVR